MEEAGADAVELNIYSIATDPGVSGAEIEKTYIDLVKQVKRSIRIPLAVKLSPFFSAPANMGVRFDEAHADGIVLFNRFYQPDFDTEELKVTPSLNLSRSEELLMRLHWTAILFGHVKADLGITGGVHTAHDVIKSILAGAKVTFMTSALLRNGVQHAAYVLKELSRWLDEHEYTSVQQMCGSMSHGAVPDPTAFERGNYMKVLSSYNPRGNVFND
jgi:dihydroorotate dehydrogenase (fumarate)